MLAKKIRKTVFGLIHEELIKSCENPREIDCNEIHKSAKKIYKKLSSIDILQMYNDHKKKKIIDYLYKNLDKSMFMYWVNGTPEKRDVRLKEYVNHYYAQMSNLEIAAICEKLRLF